MGVHVDIKSGSVPLVTQIQPSLTVQAVVQPIFSFVELIGNLPRSHGSSNIIGPVPYLCYLNTTPSPHYLVQTLGSATVGSVFGLVHFHPKSI